jgi:hypothetical protein
MEVEDAACIDGSKLARWGREAHQKASERDGGKEEEEEGGRGRGITLSYGKSNDPPISVGIMESSTMGFRCSVSSITRIRSFSLELNRGETMLKKIEKKAPALTCAMTFGLTGSIVVIMGIIVFGIAGSVGQDKAR